MLPLLCYLVAVATLAASVYLLTGAISGLGVQDPDVMFLAAGGLVVALLLATFGRICQMLERIANQRPPGPRRNGRGVPEEPRLMMREE
ncbi:MAG: hypothetical protein AAF495_20815 [Pseudomonadota bacterium]